MNNYFDSQISANLEQVRENIERACARVGRDSASVTLVAVSKTHTAEKVLAAIAAGVQQFGENRVEEGMLKVLSVEAQLKQISLSVDPTWHMIGHIQSRKVKEVVPVFDIVHSVDTVKLASKLSSTCIEHNKTLAAFFEVNVSGEESKAGFNAVGWENDRDVFARLVSEFQQSINLPQLQWRGLMTMAPIVDEMELARPVFADLRRLRDALQTELGISLPDLSMGMTDDYPVAIEEGATFIRVGRAIFGQR